MSEIVMVPVPADRLQEVYELLAHKPAAAFNNPEWTGPISDPVLEDWTDEKLERLVMESSPMTRDILAVLADFGDSWVTTELIAEEAKLTASQVVAVLGPLQKRVAGRYKMRSAPFYAQKFYEDRRYQYQMPRVNGDRIITYLAVAEEKAAKKK